MRPKGHAVLDTVILEIVIMVYKVHFNLSSQQNTHKVVLTCKKLYGLSNKKHHLYDFEEFFVVF